MELSNLIQNQLIPVHLDLDEIQTCDLKELVEDKLRQAWKEIGRSVIVEDTSLYFNAWRELPGPMVKWFVKNLGPQGMHKALQNFKNQQARAVCCLGYTSDGEVLHIFYGEVEGKIISPRGSSGFGWDSIFCPEGTQLTFAEMSEEEKSKFSPRRRSVEKFRDFLVAEEVQN
jgi:inosine triphosphate pyrophosphatase